MVSALAAAPARKAAPAQQTEEMYFDMHPKLLLDVIQQQAGSLAKAILEGVMNSVDAKATRCDVTLSSETVIIHDDGQGITDRASIEKFFKTFGQPHEASEKKTFGTFRMGRGQMFAYGHNLWRTGPFTMDVDIKLRGLKFILTSGFKNLHSCNICITLYEKLSFSSLAETERMLAEWVKYAPIPVYLNGKQISKELDKEKWTHTIPEAYVKLDRDRASLSLYNQGIHTMDIPNHRFGVGGVIVSRDRIKVNFARNEVMSDCPMWKKIKPFIDEVAGREIKKKATLNDAERRRLIDRVKQGDIPDGAEDLKLFTAVNGRHYSAEQIRGCAYNQYRGRLTHTASGSRIGDKVFQSKSAFVLATQTLEAFGVQSVKSLLRFVFQLCDIEPDDRLKTLQFEVLSKSINDKYEILPEKELTELERIWRDLANFGLTWVLDYRSRRRAHVGRAVSALAWTDGNSFVACNRDFIKTLKLDLEGIVRMAVVLLHERCHDDSDARDHVHGHEFYEDFHNRAIDRLPLVIDKMVGRLPQVIELAGRRMNRDTLYSLDKHADIVTQMEGMIKIAKKKAAEPVPEGK